MGDEKCTTADIFDDFGAVCRWGVGIQSCDRDIRCFKGGDLVVHQGK